MARRSFNLAQAVSKIIFSDSKENDETDSADDILSCHNDPDSDCEDHFSKMISLVITALPEVLMKTPTLSQKLIETVDEVRDLHATRIAPGLARPVDTIVDAFKFFISADIVDLIVEHSNSKAHIKRLSKLHLGKISQTPTLSHAAGWRYCNKRRGLIYAEFIVGFIQQIFIYQLSGINCK